MPTALDYSSGPPSGAAVRAAGHSGVVRYAGTPGNPKNITRREFQDHDRNGVGVALIFEHLTGDALKGWNGGVASAHAIIPDAASIGFPSSRPLYYAVDQDITTDAQMEVVKSYFGGICSVHGSRPVGVYGKDTVLNAVMGAGLAEYGWQSAAWSGGRAAKRRHLFQRIGGTVVDGVGCDINDILAADWGQHNAQEADMDSNQAGQLAYVNAVLQRYPTDKVTGGQVVDGVWYADAAEVTRASYVRLAAMDAKLDALAAALAAATKDPNITLDAVKQIVTDAVRQNIAIDGTVHIGPAAQS